MLVSEWLAYRGQVLKSFRDLRSWRKRKPNLRRKTLRMDEHQDEKVIELCHFLDVLVEVNMGRVILGYVL